MIKEIAVEPEVMATWSHFRELWDDCGVSRGRLISEFPSDWRDIVCRRAYEVCSAKAASIAAKLKPPPGQSALRKWIRTNRAYDKGKDWLTNAEKHETSHAFDVIVARSKLRTIDVCVGRDWVVGTCATLPWMMRRFEGEVVKAWM